MRNLVVHATIERIGAVATLPAVALRIMRIADDPASTEETLHDALVSDPALAARVLKVVNSAFYRRQREVATPRAAIRLLGVDAIRNVALAASLHRLFRGRHATTAFDPGTVWHHCVATGTAARLLAVRTGIVAPEEAMLAGLLHDIGLIVAMQAWLPQLTTVLRRTTADPALRFCEVEREEIGATHAEFGGALCDAWNFPASLAAACRHHHDFRTLPWQAQGLPALIHLADALAARVEAGFTRTVDADAPSPEAQVYLQLSEEEVTGVEHALREALPQAASLLAA
jgi:HD-like signal output (HDOD) protein